MTGQMKRRIRERWMELRPQLLIEARRCGAPDPSAQMEVWRLDHTRHINTLLERGVRLRKIRRWGWDDPRLGEQSFGIILDKAITNLKKRTRSRPPVGLAKFTRKRVPSTRTTQGDNE